MAEGWGLEVVRGGESGRIYPIGEGACVLGNGLNGEPGIDLGSHEGSSPRRMAPRQAVVECSPAGLTLRDLESPGGTFVNRQRVLAAQARRLEPGDVVQLGSVQLRVVKRAAVAVAAVPPASARAPSRPAAAAATAAPRATPGLGLPSPYALATGAVCRTWDDFLTLSAQDWAALRDELISGRIDSFLDSVGRDDLRPRPAPGKTPDERLDDWLGRLPAQRAAAPDLEVHPSVVRVRAVPGGGLTRTKVVITNTGYRLLRSTVRIEPPGTAWLRVGQPFATGTFATAESTEVPLEVEIPEVLTNPLVGALLVESNGGSRRVEVRLEPQTRPESTLVPTEPETGGPGFVVGAALKGWPAPSRVAIFAALGFGARLLIVAGDRIGSFVTPVEAAAPSLVGPALLGAAAGGLAGARFALRRGEPGHLASAAFAGGFAGVLAAAVAVAGCRAVEPSLGATLAGSWLATSALWAALGAVAAAVSLVLVPFEKPDGGEAAS